jgi:hypothetical protein
LLASQSLAKTHLLLSDEERAVSFAVSLGMAIHKLTANAAKFGALSVYGGKVNVSWNVTIEPMRRILRSTGWKAVAHPSRNRSVRDSAAPNGVLAHCELPLPAEAYVKTRAVL